MPFKALRRLAPLIAVLGLIAARPALADIQAGVVDMQRILAQSAAGKSIQTQIEAERRKLTEEVRRTEEDLKRSDQELRAKRATLGETAWKAEAGKFTEKAGNARERVQARNKAIEQAFERSAEQLLSSVREIVSDVAREKQLSLVFNRQNILFLADRNLDITDAVMDRLNAKLPSVPVVIGAAAPAGAPGKR